MCIVTFALLIPVSLDAQPGKLIVEVLDGTTGSRSPVQVRLTDSYGHVAPLPDEAIGIMYGRNDKAEGYAYQPDSAFYVDGSF